MKNPGNKELTQKEYINDDFLWEEEFESNEASSAWLEDFHKDAGITEKGIIIAKKISKDELRRVFFRKKIGNSKEN